MDSVTPNNRSSPHQPGKSPNVYSAFSPRLNVTLRLASSSSSLMLSNANFATAPGSPSSSRSARSSKVSSILDDLDDVTPPQSQNSSPLSSDNEFEDDTGAVKRKSVAGTSRRRPSALQEDRTSFPKGQSESNDMIFPKDFGTPNLFRAELFGSKQSLFAHSANVYSSMHRLRSQNSNDSLYATRSTIPDVCNNVLAAQQCDGSSLPPVVSQKSAHDTSAPLTSLTIACPPVSLADEKLSFPRTSAHPFESDTEILDGVTACSPGLSPTNLYGTGTSYTSTLTPGNESNQTVLASSFSCTTKVATTNMLRTSDGAISEKIRYHAKHRKSNPWLAFWDRNNDGIIDLFDTLRAFLALYRARQISLPRLLCFLPFLLAIHLTLAIFTSPNGLIMPFRSIKACLSWPIHIMTWFPRDGYQGRDRFRRFVQQWKRLGIDIRSVLNQRKPDGNG